MKAYHLLLDHGYTPKPPSLLPEDHHHLVPVVKKVNGLKVCVEIHHHLFAPLPHYPSLTYEKLRPSYRPFRIEGFQAQTLGDADMLWHLYQHGLGMPLVYEPYRLNCVADLITMAEKGLNRIGWASVFKKYPKLRSIFASLHHLSPWSEPVVKKLALKIKTAPRGVGHHFEGWPRRHLAKANEVSVGKFIRDTMSPPQWWLQIYYPGIKFSFPISIYRVRHWLHLLWWIRLYWPLFYKHHLPFLIKR